MAPARSVSPPTRATVNSTQSRTSSARASTHAVRRPQPGRHDQQLVSALEVLAAGPSRAERGRGALTRRDRLAVGDLGQRRDHDARAGDLRAPTQVEVFAEQRDHGSNPRSVAKRSARTSVTPAGRDEDVALEVLLAVVDLADLDAFAHDPEAIAGLTDVQEHEGVFVGDELGRDDARVRAKGRFDHQLHARRVRGARRRDRRGRRPSPRP